MGQLINNFDGIFLMFDSVELPSEICKHLVSITPILGISGSFDDYYLWIISKYFPISSNQILIPFPSKEPPEELSLNILRKGEDDTMIASFKQSKLDSKVLEEGKKIVSPVYNRAIITFETRLSESSLITGKQKLAVYDIVCAYGVGGLDPDFNDEITIAKTIEVMSPTPVDTLVVKKKLK